MTLTQLLLIGLPVATPGSTVSEQHCELCGRWRSNAERTLVEMEQSPLLSDKQRRFFRDGFYGQLVVEISENRQRAYFPDQSPASVRWEPWQLVVREGSSLKVKYTLGDKEFEREVQLDGNCYRMSQPELGFGEWFCREP